MRIEKVVVKERIQILRESGLYISAAIIQLLLSQAGE